MKTTFWGIVPTNSSKQHQSDIDTVPKAKAKLEQHQSKISANKKTAPIVKLHQHMISRLYFRAP
jgi:hypothetical protein